MPVLPDAARPLRVLHLSDIHMTPSQRASRSGSGRSPTSSRTWSSTPATTSRTSRRCRSCSTRSAPCSTCPGLRVRLQRLLRAPRCATRCDTSCPTTAGATPTTANYPGGSYGTPSRPPAGSTSPTPRPLDGRRPRRSPRRASTTRTCGTTTCRVGGRPTATPIFGRGRHAPYLRVLDLRGRRLQAILAGHTHGGQVCVPVLRRPRHQLRPRARRAPRASTVTCRSRPSDPGILLAARLGRLGARRRAVPGRLPPRGDPADPDARD